MTLQIRHKLFIVILLANIVLAVLLFSAVGWNFKRSFQDYVFSDKANEMKPLLAGLAETYYKQGNNWHWLAGNQRRWQQLLREYLGPQEGDLQIPALDTRPRLGNQDRPIRQPARPRHPISKRLLLRDAKKRPLIALPPSAPGDAEHSIQWLPILVNGDEVGELGVMHSRQMAREIDRRFVSHQLQQSAWIFLGGLLISAGLAFPFARHLVKPVSRLQQSLQRLAGGQLAELEPLPVTSSDELGRLAQAFNLLTETLRDNLKARQQWVADISHELRTPVAILQGELEALIDGIRPLEPDALKSLHTEVERLTHLINDLYELSLSDRGSLTYQREALSLEALLSDFLEDSRSRLKEHDVALEFDSPGEALPLFADESRLIQLFRNLLNNSLRYTYPGGRLRIQLVEDKTRQHVKVLWEDSEPGVTDEDLERLFERLYRTDSARDRVSGGFGLGLAICRAIVEGHQGHINVAHSELGGLAIRIQLPLFR